MSNLLKTILVVLLSMAVIIASSLCAIEGSVHPAETESHDHGEHEHNENANNNSHHSHQNNENDICCENLLAYFSTIKRVAESLPVLLKITSLLPQVEISTISFVSTAKLFPDILHGFSSRQWERYALSNPPNGPPVI